MLLRIFTTWGFAFIPSKSPRGTLISYHLSKVFTISNCEWRLALRRRWQPETPFLLSADNETSRLRVGEGSVVARVSASNKQILNSDERPWEGVQGRKALRRGKPMFICNHICDVWQHDSGGGRREKKIPTAALEHFFFSPFDHLNIFAVKDATGEQEKTAVLIKVHFFVCVCFVQTVVPDIHFSKTAEALDECWIVTWGRLSPQTINSPQLPLWPVT